MFQTLLSFLLGLYRLVDALSNMSTSHWSFDSNNTENLPKDR